MIGSNLRLIGMKIPTLDKTAPWNEDEVVTPNRSRGAAHVRSGDTVHDEGHVSQGTFDQRDRAPDRARPQDIAQSDHGRVAGHAAESIAARAQDRPIYGLLAALDG